MSHESTRCLGSFVYIKGRKLRCIHQQLAFHSLLNTCRSPAALQCFLSLRSCVLSFLTHVPSSFRPARLFTLSCCVVLSDHAANRSRACECAVPIRAHRRGRPFITSSQQVLLPSLTIVYIRCSVHVCFMNAHASLFYLTNIDTPALCTTEMRNPAHTS